MTNRFLRRLGRHLLYGWGKRRLPFEDAVLQAARAAMPEADQAVFNAQMAALERVQRWSGGRILRLSIDPDVTALPLFSNTELEHCLARVRLRCGRQRHTALLMTSSGRLSTLEFKRAPHLLRTAAYEIEDVSFNVEQKSVTEAVDRLEHGRAHEQARE